MCEGGAPYLRPYFKRDFATRPGTAQDGPAHRTPVAHGVRPRSVSAATSPTTARSLLRGPDRARPTPPPSQLTPARIAEPRRWPRWTGDPSSTLRDGPCRRYDIGPARRPRLLARVRPPRPANASIRRPRAILPSSRPRRPRRPTLADASTPAPAPPPQLAARARPQGGGEARRRQAPPMSAVDTHSSANFRASGWTKELDERNPKPMPGLHILPGGFLCAPHNLSWRLRAPWQPTAHTAMGQLPIKRNSVSRGLPDAQYSGVMPVPQRLLF